MKAFVYTEYGSPDVLRFVEVEKPVPGDGEVLVRVRAASVNALDWRLMRGKPWFARPAIGGLLKPKATRPGADVAGVVDAVGQNVTRSGRRFDLILAANAHHSIFDYRRALAPNGIYVMAGGGGVQTLQGMLLGPLLSRLGRRKLRFFIAAIRRPDLEQLAGLLAAGSITPVIDRRYPLPEAADAIRYLEEGHARGKVVITVAP